ncbi:hypothetical protein EYR40_006127 [Pleurotus pulmonarius]|nr:hypothetical protein EYR36_010750 [Pleurotus pulmonarius]KAF4599038.1 hypothetical protein EYR40_006127 [Pleurotus pulmonarius]
MSSQFSASTPVVTPSTVAQMGDLVKALQDAQLENGELKLQLTELKDKIAALEASKPHRGKRGSNVTAGTVNSGDGTDDNRLARIAKRYAIMNQLWVPDNVFPVLRPPKPSNDPSYYGARENWMLGMAAELYEVFPEEMHSTLRLANTGAEFRFSHAAQRQAMAHTLRNCAARIFDTIGVPSQAFKDKDSRRSSPELIALLKPGKNGLYPSLPPLLYPPGNTIDVFQNPVLPLILRVALFGKTSLTSTPAANSSGRKWAVTHVTTGSICLAAIMARFLASPDNELSPIGGQTKINYEQDFHDYYGLIESTKTTRKGRQLRALFQQTVFKEIPASLDLGDSDGDSEQDDASEFARIKAAMLDADNSNSDSDNDGQDSQRRTNAAFEPFELPSPPPPSPSPTPSPALSYITAASPAFPQSVDLEELGPRLRTIPPVLNGQPFAFAHSTQFDPSTSRLQPLNNATRDLPQDEPVALPEMEPARGKGRGRGVKKPRGKAAAAGVRDEQPRRTSARTARG